MAGVTHGAAAWRTRRCRCEECRQASNDLQARNRMTRVSRLRRDPTLAPHGEVSTYCNWGCRCRPCTDAQTARCRDYAVRTGRRVSQ